MFINLEDKENSAPGDSDRSFCSEAPQNWGSWQNPVFQGAVETPLTGEEHSSPGTLRPENLEGLTQNVDTLGLLVTRKNRCGAAKKRSRKAKLTEMLARLN